MHTNTLFYRSPAQYWMDALPIGNGALGAMCYSGVKEDRMVLNHDTLWTGYPRITDKKGASEAYKKAQALALRHEYRAAQEEIEKNFLTCWSQAYMTFGELVLEFDFDTYENYERKLDLSSAVLKSRYESGTQKLEKTAFVSHPHNVLVYRIESKTGEPFSFTAKLDCPLRSVTAVVGDVLCVDGECPGDSDRNNPDYPCSRMIYSEKDEERGIQFRGGLKAVTDGAVRAADGRLLVEDATHAALYFTIQTSYNGFDRHPVLEGREYKNACIETLEAAAAAGLEAVLAEHTADHKRFYDRVSLQLGDAGNDVLPTDERIGRFAEDGSDLGLYVLLFNFGRYLAIASSRPGTQATNLQGIWNNSTKPAWNCNYTVNINTEMNYWPILPCAMPELMQPLIDLVKKISVTGEHTAKAYYNARGFTAHHNADLWGFTAPAKNSASWGFWPGASGWLCRSVFETYLYSGDIEYLRETAFPLMRKAARFYLDILIENKQGELVICPATSPENIFISEDGKAATSESTAMMNSIALDLFVNCRKACEILQVRDDFYNELCTAISGMKPLQIGENGTILEWNEPLEETEVHHRHVSHLYALHPAGIITQKDNELFKACRKTLEIRGDDGTGWSLAWKINFWARLLDGDHALQLIDLLLNLVPSWSSEAPNYHGGGGLYPNMLDAHPPFQIDGNFGAVSGICEMLLQYDDDCIYLLPALPKKWDKGAVRGLAAPGGIHVDIAWENGRITKHEIHDAPDRKIVLCR